MRPSGNKGQHWPVITITTDFGLGDWFVASLKGVLTTHSPRTTLIDVTHDVPPGDIARASFVIARCVTDFPDTTVHLAVVDPGVGSKRLPIAIRTPKGGWLVGPDNGLFTHTISRLGGILKHNPLLPALAPLTTTLPDAFTCYKIPMDVGGGIAVSTTFHGRDVFAHAAAKLVGTPGGRPDWVKITSIKTLNLGSPKQVPGTTCGQVQHVDRFGNLITNIPYSMLSVNARFDSAGLLSKNVAVGGWRSNYEECDTLGWVCGSHGFAEVAAFGVSAAQLTGLNIGSKVRFIEREEVA